MMCSSVFVENKWKCSSCVFTLKFKFGRSQWSCGLRRRYAAVHLLKLRVRIPSGTWMFVSCECGVLSGRGLCDGLITHPEEFT